MIAWKPMVVYGGPNHLHRPWGPPKPGPWGPTKPNPWGRTNPVADHEKRYHSTQPKNIETSAFDTPDIGTPDMSDYLDDYEQGSLLKGMTTIRLLLHLWYKGVRIPWTTKL